MLKSYSIILFYGFSLFFIILLSLFFSPITSAAPDLTPKEKGVTWLLNQKWKLADGTYNWVGIESDALDMQNGDITWARLSMSQSNPDNNYYDRVFEIMGRYNIKPLITITGTPSKDVGTPEQREAFKTWLTGQVQRYALTVRHWEAGNEPNDPGFWNVNYSSPALLEQSVQNYIYRLQDTYDTIKAVDPTATVMMGGVAEWDFEEWIDVFISLQGYQHMDAMAFHPYRKYPEEVLGRFQSLKNKMAQIPEFANKPIWITEIGFHTWAQGNSGKYVPTEALKAEYVRQTMQKLYENGAVLPIFYYTLVEPGISSTFFGYGLIAKNQNTMAVSYNQSYYYHRDFWENIFLINLFPTQDSYVSASSASSNFGSSTKLYNQSSPEKLSLYKFDLSQILAVDVADVVFKLHTTSDSTANSTGTHNIKEVVDSSWGENSVTYNNKPSLLANILGSFIPNKTFEWYNITLPLSNVQSKLGNLISFGVTAITTDDSILFSREYSGGVKPQLMVYYSTPGSLPSPTPSPTPSTNLISNPGCESSTASWNGFQGSISRVTTDVNSGVGSCRSSWNNIGNYFSMTTTYNLVTNATIGAKYKGTAWVKASHVSSIGKSVQLILRQKGAGLANKNTNSASVILSTIWQQIPEVTATIDDNGRSMDMYLIQNSAATNNAILVDDISVISLP